MHRICSSIIFAIALLLLLFDYCSCSSYRDGIHRRLADCHDLEYENPSDTYSPGEFVEYGHELSGNDEFCVEQEYNQQIAVPVFTIFGIFTLMGLLLILGLMCRCCVGYCQCQPDLVDGSSFDKDKICTFAVFYVLCLLVLVLDQLVYIGSADVNKGLDTLDTEVGSIYDTFKDLQDDGQVMIGLGDTLSQRYTAALNSCNATTTVESMESAVSNYEDTALGFFEETKPAVKDLDDAVNYFDQYSSSYRVVALYLVWGLSILCVLLLFLTNCFKSMFGMQLSVFLSILVYALYTGLILLWTSFVTIFGDFCMDPSRSAVVSASDEENVQDLAIHFSTCIGNSTLDTAMFTARQDINEINSTLTVLLRPPENAGSNCPGDSNVIAMQATVNDVYDQLNSATELLTCGPIQSQWFAALNEGLCEQLYNGVFSIWLSQLVTSFFLLFLIVAASITWQYHDGIADVVPVDKHGRAATGGGGSGRGSGRGSARGSSKVKRIGSRSHDDEDGSDSDIDNRDGRGYNGGHNGGMEDLRPDIYFEERDYSSDRSSHSGGYDGRPYY